MSIVSAIVLFAVVWFMVLFVMLPLNLETQGDRGEVVPGTHESSPADFRFRKMARKVTLVSVVVWGVLVAVILSGAISVRDFDWFGRMPQAGETSE